MEKKIYEKPTVECVVFYSEEEITSVQPSVDYYAQLEAGQSDNQIFSTEIGEGEGEDGWGN